MSDPLCNVTDCGKPAEYICAICRAKLCTKHASKQKSTVSEGRLKTYTYELHLCEACGKTTGYEVQIKIRDEKTGNVLRWHKVRHNEGRH